MSDTIKWNDFSAGWVPSDDEVNGRKNGFTQMNNVELDENGALSLCNGTQVVYSGFPTPANTIFSHYMGGTRYDYINDNDGSIYRNAAFINSGGNPEIAAFGTAFDFVLYCSGTVRKKDDGTDTTPIDLGVAAATSVPGISVNATNNPFKNISPVNSQFAMTAGAVYTLIDNFIQITINTDNGYGGIQSYYLVPVAIDCNQLQGIGGSGNIGNATDNDYIIFGGYVVSPWGKSIQLDIILEPGNAAGDKVNNYYSYIVEDIAAGAVFDVDGTFTVRIKRSEFIRNGPGQQGWSTVYGFRITYHGSPGLDDADPEKKINLFGSSITDPMIRIVGGDKTQNGSYQYMQVNVNNTGSYIAKSPKGLETRSIDITMSQALITPVDPTIFDPQCNEAWIYRRGGFLAGWYRVAVFTAPWAAAHDAMSDISALKLNIKWNDNLISIRSVANGVPDDILAIVGPVEGRWFYFTDHFMYPSELNNPDLVDASVAVKLTGSNAEIFLWAFKVSDRTVLIGTSADVYTLTGTFVTQPDFTIDLYYDALGCEYPPITYNAVENTDGVFYLAKDGWRVITASGETRLLVTTNTDLLYKGQNRYGYTAPNLKFEPGSKRFPIALAKNKLWCVITETARMEVMDFRRNYWYTINNYGKGEITALCGTQDGCLIAYFASDNIIREIDSNSTKFIDGISPQAITIRSLVFDNDTPHQRKDSQTFKIKCSNVGNLNTTIKIENGNEAGLTTIPSSSLVREVTNDLAGSAFISIAKTYQITITGNVTSFLMNHCEIYFQTRPPQVSFLRVQSLNYGAVARKRITAIPFQIDTLGGNVTLTPYLDNVAFASMNVNSNYKRSFNYQFQLVSNDMAKAIDYEYTFQAVPPHGLFEFFGFQEPNQKDIETFPTQNDGYVIPTSNFGSPNKKRIRVWPFDINTRGQNVIFTPIVDGVIHPSTIFNSGGDQFRTLFHYFTSDVFGIDYSGTFGGADFELRNIMTPDIVQVLPISRRFDQVGPEELFRYGKIMMLEVRVMPFNSGDTSELPFNIYFNDNTNYNNVFVLENNKESSQFVGTPKGTNGNIVRIELGPTNYDFHRFYMRIKVTKSGRDTDVEWVTLGSVETNPGGLIK